MDAPTKTCPDCAEDVRAESRKAVGAAKVGQSQVYRSGVHIGSAIPMVLAQQDARH